MNPFLLQGPAVIGFSGGRSSGLMLRRILDAHDGKLPDDVLTIFSNTGDEHPKTLDFVKEVGDRWGVDIVWLEYQDHDHAKKRWKQVTHATASRDGEPYDTMLVRKGNYLPNPMQRFCTQLLKIKPTHDYLRSLGWEEWVNAVGFRADEPRRVAKLNIPRLETPEEIRVAPLSSAGITQRDVNVFWKANDFDLGITRDWGNCVDCFLKGADHLVSLYRAGHKPVRFIKREETSGARFRNDRPGYAELYKFAISHDDLFPHQEPLEDCACTD